MTTLPPRGIVGFGAALELMTAVVYSADEEGELFKDALCRVLCDARESGDELGAVMNLLFALSALSAMLLQDAAQGCGHTMAELIGEINRRHVIDQTHE